MPTWAKWLVGGLVITGALVATILTGGTSAIATGALAGSVISGLLGVASGTTIDENGCGFDVDKAATGFMCGTITGAISGVFSGGLSKGISIGEKSFKAGSYVVRGIKSGVDGVLGMSSYFAQSAINGTDASFVGALISFGTGVLNMTDSMGKIFDAVWAPTIGAEIAWGYDILSNAFNKKNPTLINSY